MTNSADESEVEDFTVIAAAASTVVAQAVKYGIDVNPICAGLGIDPASFQSDERVSLDKICRLMEECARLSQDEAFGLRSVDVCEKGGSGAFGCGMLAAPDVRAMVEFLARHVPETTSATYFARETTEKGIVLQLTFSPLIVRRDQYIDMALAIVVSRLRDMIGDRVSTLEIDLERPQPRDIGLFRHYLSDRLTFGSRINSITFPHEILDCVNPNGDARVFALMDEQCRLNAAQRASSRKVFVDAVRAYIELRIAEPEVSLAETARHFDLSERTLQRRLAEQGTSLNDLRDAVRRDVSLALLQDSDLAVSDICFRLGYSAPSAFSRSVTRWFGASPRIVRRKAIASAGRPQARL